jgi:ubiquinone/menaquinone biosynthesis C-methylase UbiE
MRTSENHDPRCEGSHQVKHESKERYAMTTPTNPRQEHPSTYFVQDRGNVEELSRLQLQDQMVTTSMGGVLPEQPDPTIFQRVLDVGCGTGGWLIEMAKTYPSMSLLVGVDVSSKMVDYAQAQAEAQQVNDRTEFRTMDALRMLEFPTDYFDLVNQRFGTSYLRTWDWPNLLHEYQRVTQPGGVIRITESNMITESSSSALIRLNQVFLEAFYKAGHLFTSDSKGVTGELAGLLHQYGLQNMQTRAHALVYRGGTPEGQRFYEDTRLGETLLPFIRKWTRLPEDYQKLRQQVLSDMQQSDFEATWRLLTAWGNKPDP